MKTDAEREESFPLLLSTKIPLLKSTRHIKKKGLQGMVEYDTFRVVNRRVGPREGRILPSFT